MMNNDAEGDCTVRWTADRESVTGSLPMTVEWFVERGKFEISISKTDTGDVVVAISPASPGNPFD